MVSLFRLDRGFVSPVYQFPDVVCTFVRATFVFLITTLLTLPAAAERDPSAADTGALQGTVLVSAASSLTDVFSALARQFEALHPEVRIHLNFGGSAVLATQIEHGAPVAVFAAAGRLPIESLLRHKRVGAESVHVFAKGELVLVTKEAGLTLESLANSDRFLAVGNPRLAPAGLYADQTLVALNLRDRFHGRLVLGESVRQVLRYVETGAVAGGLVYRTDAATSPELLVTQTIPADVSGPIEYPIVALADMGDGLVAQKFVDYVCGAEAGEEFLRRGFLPISQAVTPSR